MRDIHSFNHIPSQNAIDSITNYQSELEKDNLNYKLLLEKLKKDIHRLGFRSKSENKMWMLIVGNDYLTNPKLFRHAPLNYICVLLGEIFKEDNLHELEKKLPATALKQLLARLDAFKVN